VVLDTDEAGVKAGRDRIEKSLANAVRRGKLDAELEARANEALRYTTDIDVLADRDLVVEAITEAEDPKTSLFRRLDEVVVSDDAILASNTSSIPMMKLAVATRRPENVVGLHFFNPVPVLPLVELVASLVTSQETAGRASAFAEEALGKHVIRSQD